MNTPVTEGASVVLGRIIEKYDPNNDTIPGGPFVTWAEHALAVEVVFLAGKIDELEAQIKRLQDAYPLGK